MTTYKCSWWGNWFRNGISSVCLVTDGLTLRYWKTSTPTFIRWTDITQPPIMKSWWIFNVVTFSAAGSNVHLRFIKKKLSNEFFIQLSQYWYLPFIVDIKVFFLEQENQLKKIGYCRTSQWIPISKRISAWGEKLPPVPNEGILSNSDHHILVGARAMVSNPSKMLVRSRKAYIQFAMAEYSDLFDIVESMPLTESQRRACVIDEDNNLVLAGAGTGKTSTIMGRVAFLIRSGKAKPEEILLLAYGREAAKEMRDRLESKLGVTGVTASTFHALGQEIIGHVEGSKPAMTPYADDEEGKYNFVQKEFEALQQVPQYRDQLLKYFEKWLYPEKNPFDFKSLGEYYRFLDENDIRTFNGEKVKSYSECTIANFLYRMGIKYDYEATYADSPLSPEFKVYTPDFYLPEYGIYIEHFGIDRKGNTAPYIDQTKYLDSINWKRNLHQSRETILIETFHFEQQEGILINSLEDKLKQHKVDFNPLAPNELLDQLREFGTISAFSKILSDLLSLFKSAHLSEEALELKIINSSQPEQLRAALELLYPILSKYEQELSAHKHIDFEDMIGKAIHYVSGGHFVGHWRYILVDEFQDISRPRAGLVKALKNQRDDTTLFCVGDDWQSIYRFTGSDIELTSKFQEYFGPTETTALDKTFRFNSSINSVASRFVMQNPGQLQKSIKSHNLVENPAVSLYKTSVNSEDAVADVLSRISRIAKYGASVYFLARFKFDLPKNLRELQRQYSQLNLKADSIHSSKGKEADFVVLLGLGQGVFGMPSEKMSHPLIEALLPKPESHPHAEERRLFYVALTRAKHRVYLIVDMTKASMFIKELLNGQYEIDEGEFDCSIGQANAMALACPDCKNGTLMIRMRTDNLNQFMGCSNYPRCSYTERVCKCGAPLKHEGSFKLCVNQACQWWVSICPVSGGDMVSRTSARGKFWGCSHYRGDETPSCGYTKNYIQPPEKIAKCRTIEQS